MEIKTGNFNELKRELYISEKALERLKKDRFIRESKNKKWYINKILDILIRPTEYPQEMIGKFHVGPRGDEKRRIAWHFAIIGNIIKVYIDDLLYHINPTNYIDNWDIKARDEKIIPKNYGHVEFKSFEQVVNL